MSNSMEVPEEKRKFYYWLCDNVGIRVANLWLDDEWEEFIESLRK